MDDKKIVQLYLSRSERAIEETASKYGRYCTYIAFGILQNDSDAEECVSDAYMKLWSSIPPQKPKHLKAFLGKVVRNLSLSRYREQSADKRGGGQLHLVLDELSQCIPLAGSDSTPHDVELKDILNRFLGGLAKKERVLFLRRYWYMSPLKELAEEYGKSESSIAVILFRTRKKLREFLEKEGVSL